MSYAFDQWLEAPYDKAAQASEQFEQNYQRTCRDLIDSDDLFQQWVSDYEPWSDETVTLIWDAIKLPFNAAVIQKLKGDILVRNHEIDLSKFEDFKEFMECYDGFINPDMVHFLQNQIELGTPIGNTFSDDLEAFTCARNS